MKIFLRKISSIGKPGSLFACSFFFLLCLVADAQTKSYRFEHLTIDDGLSQNLVFTIFQDHRGFLWFGTNDGLNCYDGYGFKIYNHLPGDSTTLMDNAVTALFEDSRRNLWVGAGGLNRYDRLNDRFEKVLSPENLPGRQASLTIDEIEEDHNGDLWIAIKNAGLYRLQLSVNNNEKIRKSPDLTGPYPFTGGSDPSAALPTVQSLLSLDSSLWVSFRNSVRHLKASDKGVFPSPEKALFQSHFSTLPLPKGAMIEDKTGGFWFGTSRELVRVPDPGKPAEFQVFNFPDGLFPKHWMGIPRKMAWDPSGKLWIATYNGLLIFDPVTESFQYILHNPDDPESIPYNNITDIVVDAGNILWFGTAGMGISKYAGNAKPFHHYLGKKQYKTIFSAYGILEDRSGDLWISANNGFLYRFDRHTGSVSPVPLKGLPAWNVTNMISDREGIFWLMNNHELIRLDPQSGQMEDFPILARKEDSFLADSIPVLYLDPEDQLWACNTQTLYRFDPSAGTFQKYPLPPHGLGEATSLYRDRKGRFWVATIKGLLRYDEKTGEWQIYLADPDKPGGLRHNRLKCLFPDPLDPDRYLWLGTGGGGLHRLDMRENSFQVYTKKDGLPSDFIYGIRSDESGKLWMSTNHGLSRFDLQTGEFTNFQVEDGLQSNEFNSRAFYKSNRGELFFGGINGITAFFPEQILPNPHVPPVVITDMQLSYESVDHRLPGSPLKHAITETSEIALNHNQNDLAFEFSALDFTLPEHNQYRYMIEGFDENWIEAGVKNRATYTNLPPGRYTFRVQGANNDGIWNEEGASVQVRIAPPWWKTSWAYLLYLLSATAICWYIYHRQSERYRMQRELRMKEIETQKLAELDQFKSQFFANVSHEFRTPITLIQGRIDELLDQLGGHELRTKLKSVQRNSLQLLRLVDQLLDIARLESGKMGLNQQPGDLVPFVRLLVYSLQSGADNKGVSLSFQSDQKPLPAMFDRDALQKILQNLIFNAIKFTPPDGEIKVILSKVDPPDAVQTKDQEWVKIEVMDNGRGIPATDLPHIFNRFYQAGSAGSTSSGTEKGFGLGLALVRELVTLNEGNIKVESEEGQGATFTIVLPLMASPVPIRKTGELPVSEVDQSLLALELSGLQRIEPHLNYGMVNRPLKQETGKSNRILIVEDHPELRQYIAGILEPDHKIIQACDGGEGWEKALQLIPDLIISDIMMPNLDGYALADQLRKDRRTSHIPVVLLTAKAETKDRLKGLAFGADDYLVKPFNKAELKSRVRNLLRKRELLKKKYSRSLLAGVDAHQEDSVEELFLKKVKTAIEKNIGDENFGVELLAKEMGMSSSQLYRKLRALTGLTTVQLIQQIRLENAVIFLKKGYNVTEVTYRVGLRSPAYFSQLFKKHFGCSPREYETL